jgi:hypothetical protein
MSLVGKVQGALSSLSNENVLALANFNFDFSLFKVEAPPEFTGLGNALSTSRRIEAEEGVYHQVARRLGALFEQVIPSTPELVRAYGQRVSEIFETPGINPKGSKKDGLFEKVVGADGTSIWAAATSGSSAIAVHLLGCMLARMWPPDKATSIWVEMVERRKHVIKNASNSAEPHNWASVLAAQQVISRTELAHWDASARAWLSRADEAKAHQQTQLMLIVKNLNVAVNGIVDTYESVMDAWSIALRTVEKLVKGMPQLGHDGAVLLGLAAWHLYPPLNVLSKGPELIEFHDDLVARGGILTIGLEDAVPGPKGGVRWSLPLAHLRFYGEPILSCSSLSADAERLPLRDFFQVVLGCALKSWGYSTTRETQPVIQILAEMWLFVRRSPGLLRKDIERCLQRLQNVKKEKEYQEIEDIRELKKAQQTRKDGTVYTRRNQILEEERARLEEEIARGRAAIGYLDDILESTATWPMLLARAAHDFCTAEGIQKDQYKMLQALGTRQSGFLGEAPASMKVAFGLTDPGVISWISKNQEEEIGLLRDLGKCLDIPNRMIIKYALSKEHGNHVASFQRICALTTATTSNKRDHEGHTLSGHCRWIAVEEQIPDDRDRGKLEEAWANQEVELGINEDFCMASQRVSCRHTNYGPAFTWISSPWIDKAALSSDDEQPGTLFHLLCGDPDQAALYFTGDYPKQDERDLDAARALGLVLAFKTNRISVPRLLGVLDHISLPEGHPYSQAIKGLCAAAQLYQTMPSASISLQVVSIPIHTASWIPSPAPVNEAKAATGDSHIPEGIFTTPEQNLSCDSAENFDLPLFGGDYDGYGLLFNMDQFFDFSRTELTATIPMPKDGKTFWGQWRAPALDRCRAFACIVFFESGSYDISAKGLKNVMAVSCGDSIYAAASLLSDPDTTSNIFEVKRIIGNIGRPGIALLVPPTNSQIRQSRMGKYYLVKHEVFDGQLTDEFPKTQVELSFTGYEQSVDIGSHGACDTTVYILEARIRVYDAGSWVGDLNVLAALDSPLLKRLQCSCSAHSCTKIDMGQKGCEPRQTGEEERAKLGKNTMTARVISIDCWEEFLQRPFQAGIVRAHGNWLARLAATSLSVQQNYTTLVLPRNICWSCVRDAEIPDDCFVIL